MRNISSTFCKFLKSGCHGTLLKPVRMQATYPQRQESLQITGYLLPITLKKITSARSLINIIYTGEKNYIGFFSFFFLLWVFLFCFCFYIEVTISNKERNTAWNTDNISLINIPNLHKWKPDYELLNKYILNVLKVTLYVLEPKETS